MKAELHGLIQRRFPSLWQWYAYRRYLTAAYGEPEIRFLSQVVNSNRHAIDVGVFEGIYSRRLTQLCRGVIGFEANPASAAFCQAALGRSAVIHNCALSDRAGVVTLRLPELAAGAVAVARRSARASLPTTWAARRPPRSRSPRRVSTTSPCHRSAS